ncbi:hypothetical protein ADL27_32400 [Streptomyces sp. NRRL F-6602]|nr:hypothetical protein ADL27_32400 [Streptomyces sp. NRRL F-6602]
MSTKRYTPRFHGLSESVYKALLEKQGGGCRLCGQSPSGRALAIDHDHSCCPGKKSCGECVRGLLCVYCNTRLAALEDEDFLNGALMYLSDTSANPSRTVRLAAEWLVS